MKKIISLVIVCMIIISGMFMYNKNDKKDLLEDNNGPIIAAVIDGKASTTFPTTNKYTATVECTRNGKKIDANESITWNGTKWILTTAISDGNVRCNTTFETIVTFKDIILAKNEVKTPLTTPGAAVSTESEALLASTEDDYGTSYYFRGAVTNNYVEFANKCWRIVRVAGDNTVKLVLHNNNSSNVNNPCAASNNDFGVAFIGDYAFNTNYNDNAYVGFMYGTSGSTNYANTHANTNKSTILTNLEAWYTSNLASYANKISDTIWCNDKNISSSSYNPFNYTMDSTKLGYGTNATYYAAMERLVSSSRVAGGTGLSLKCNGKLSKISSKIGLLTIDEVAFAGGIYDTSSSYSYLNENTSGSWWTMSPAFYKEGSAVWHVNSDGYLGYGVSDLELSVRPSISLISAIEVIGKGISDNPYIIK